MRRRTFGEPAPSDASDQSTKVDFIKKEGWLDKLSPRSVLKDVWQKRWVVLAEGEMCYYKEPDSQSLGVVPLSHVEKISGEGNRIIISMLPQFSAREWKWRAETAHEAQQWREALESVRAIATGASEMGMRYESGATVGKYWKKLDPSFKQQSLIAGRSYRTGSTAPGPDRTAALSEPASGAGTKLNTMAAVNEGVEVEDSAAPRWARKRGHSTTERPKEVLYMEGMLTKLNKKLGQIERFYVLNGNKMTGYKNARQDERASTWFMEQLTHIEVVKTDGRAMLSLEMNGVDKIELVGRSEEDIRQWGAKLAAAHVQYGGVLNISDLLHGPNKKSALYKQLEAQGTGQQAGTIIDLWCSNFDDKAGKDLSTFLDAAESLNSGLLAQLEAQLLPGTDITRSAMQSLHDCLYGVIVPFIDDWQMQSPALIVPLLDWLASYQSRLKRMAVVDLYPDILNLPVAKEMVELTCPFVCGQILLLKSSSSGKPKYTKRWFSMRGSCIKSFDSQEQEESGALPLQTIHLSGIASVERDGKQIKLLLPKESSAKKNSASKPDKDSLSSRFPPGFISDLVQRLNSDKDEGSLPFDSSRHFPGYELAEWMCSISDLSYKIKRRDVAQGLAQSLVVSGAVVRVDGGTDWDEDVDYMFAVVEEETFDEMELVTERDDAAIIWQLAIECVRRSLKDKSRRRFGSGIPEIKTRFESDGQSAILDEVQSVAIEVFQKCDDLADYLSGSQALLDRAAAYLDDLMFEEEFKACFDFVFDSFFSKAFTVIINYCKENYHHWRQAEFISLATWASALEGRVLQYDDTKLDMFNVVDQVFFTDLMDMYNEAVSQEIQRLVLNLIAEDIKAKSEPLVSSEGQLKSLAIVDLMAIYNQSLSLVIGTGNAVVVTSAIKFTLPVLELFPKTYLQKLQSSCSSLPVEHVVSVLNAFHEGSHCVQALEDQLRAIVPEKFFEQLSFDGPSGAFNRAWKDGCRIVVRVIAADVHPLIQKVGDKSWLNGSVTANWLATMRDYFGDLNRWMIPAIFRKLSSDALDDNLRMYAKAILAAKINIDDAFLERADMDLEMIREVFSEFARINFVSTRMGLISEFIELLVCDYDDVRRGFLSLVLSTDIHIGIVEKLLEMRDCKRSVRKDILEECRVNWHEPEASDDEATYALAMSGVDIRLIPSGCEKFGLFSECGVSGAWPEWKERRDKDRKDRFAALKASKELGLQKAKELEKQAENERRAASLAAHQKAHEDAKRIAKQRALEAESNASKLRTTSGSSTDLQKGKSRSSESVAKNDMAQEPSWSRNSTDLSLSQQRAQRNAADCFKAQLSSSAADATPAAQHSQSGSETVKETMKEKITRQKLEAAAAACVSSVPRTAGDAFFEVVKEAVQALPAADSIAGKETLKEKIARQKREAAAAPAAEASSAAVSAPTLATSNEDSVLRARSDSSASKETLKEKIARQKREADLAAAASSLAVSPTPAAASVDADDFRNSGAKETLKEKIARQKMEAELAAMSTSDFSAASPAPSICADQQVYVADSIAGKETLKEKIARQKREAAAAPAAEASSAAVSAPTLATSNEDSVLRARSDSSASKETLKEKIARAKREAELAASSVTPDLAESVAALSDAAVPQVTRSRTISSSGETLKERIARQKEQAAPSAAALPSDGSAVSTQPQVSTIKIGGLSAKRGSVFMRSIQRPAGIDDLRSV